MSTVTSIFSRMSPDRRQIEMEGRVAKARDNIAKALVGIDRQDRIHPAKARVENLVRMNKDADESVAQVEKWARCAIDPSDPTPPKVA